MNKNTRRRLKLAQKNHNIGQSANFFEIPQTIPGSSLGSRRVNINIGGNTNGNNSNMRQVIVKNSNPNDSKTFHEPVDRTKPFCSNGKVNIRGQDSSGKPKEWKYPNTAPNS